MPVSRYPSGLAMGGGRSGATSSGVVGALRFSFDPTSSAQVLLGYLPAGAVPVDVLGYGGTTGGTNPTVDIGTAGDDDGIANELDADATGTSAAAAAKIGVLLNTQFTTRTAVYGKVGGSAGTGGTMKGAILYIVEDV